MERKKIKINIFLLLKYFYPVTIVIILIILSGVFWFLYNNVYKTLSYAQEITQLKQKVPLEDLQKEKFDKIIEQIKTKKNEKVDLNQIKDPFIETIDEIVVE